MLSGLLRQCCGYVWTRAVFNNCGSQLDLVVQAPATEMTSHRLWKAYKALSPTQMILLACGGGTAAGAVVYALTAATDPEQRLARAREEMMRIPRAPGERGRAGRGEGPDAPRATDGRGVENGVDYRAPRDRRARDRGVLPRRRRPT